MTVLIQFAALTIWCAAITYLLVTVARIRRTLRAIDEAILLARIRRFDRAIDEAIQLTRPLGPEDDSTSGGAK